MFPTFDPLFTNVSLETAIIIAVLGAVGTGLVLFGTVWFLYIRSLKKRQIIGIPRKLRSQSSSDDKKKEVKTNETN